MRYHELGVPCDLCGSRDQVTTVWIQLPPSVVRTEICRACRRTATAVEALDAGRPRSLGRPCEDVVLSPPNLL